MSLILESVTVSRGVGPVISDVSLTVEPGEITTIVGPNGAGKTSLLEAVSGLVTSVTGDIRMDGKALRRTTKRKRALLGITHVEQGRAIFPSLTVRENLRLTARTKASFDEAMAPFPELEKRLDSASVLLSGGEQQMLVLARAFASRPKYLLIDEMSLGLAPVVFKRLLPTITEVAGKGVGVLLVEQFAHAALSVATNALVTTNGRVTYSGPAATIAGDAAALERAYLGD